jgi:large subunit ribosomal protein L6
MSRIGKLPITVPQSATVTISGKTIVVKGPKGELSLTIPDQVTVVQEADKLIVTSDASNLHGLIRTLVANNVHGVTEGWSKVLEVNGTGYRAATTGSELNLSLGFSHPVIIKAPAGISFQVVENKITVSGFDKTLVGEVAAKIRKTRPADPYKAKGMKYEGEVIRRKAGKAAKAAGGTGK